MIMLPDLHPMKASVVANHGLQIIKGWPPKFAFFYKIKKSTGYSHESKETMISSNIPSGITLDLSANSKIVVVDLMLFKSKCYIVSVVITFILAPKSINVFGTEKTFY